MLDGSEEVSYVFEEEVPENLDEIDGVPTGTWYDVSVESIKVYGEDDSRAKRLNLRLKVLGPTHVGESIFVSYGLPHPAEHAFARNRRLTFLRDTGLIDKADQGTAARIDYGRLKGAEFTVEYEAEASKKDPSKPFKQVAFHGWHPLGWRPDSAPQAAGASAAAVPAGSSKAEDFDNI